MSMSSYSWSISSVLGTVVSPGINGVNLVLVLRVLGVC